MFRHFETAATTQRVRVTWHGLAPAGTQADELCMQVSKEGFLKGIMRALWWELRSGDFNFCETIVMHILAGKSAAPRPFSEQGSEDLPRGSFKGIDKP